MTAAVHILCGPAGAGKTRRFLQRYREVVRAGLGTALWLGPTCRYVEGVRERLLEDSGSLLSPQLFAFQDFVDEVVRVNEPKALPLSHVQRRLLADDIVAELHRRGELSHFRQVVDTRGFLDGVFALLAELKRNEIWPAQFARAAYRRGYEGEQFGRELNWHRISFKERQCARIYAQYQRRLIRHHLYDLEGRFWFARDLLARGLRRPFERVRAVFVDGFTDFTRTQHEILEAFCPWVEELWIALPDETGDERAELFTRPRATLERLKGLQPRVERLEKSRTSLSARPVGLRYLARQLFRPLRSVEQSDHADGLSLIEAPGMVGEGRMVARRIKALLVQGTPADDIVVSMRDVLPYADLLLEVFAEYGIPVDVEGTEPLSRVPAVATLLRNLHLPDDDWPFAGVTALLRSSYFRPDWPETRECPEIAQHAEVLLRLLGEPRGREAYLEAVRRWAEKPPAGLEDEQAEESRRLRTHELAKRCRAFLQRFFPRWDGFPAKATPRAFVAWLRSFVEDLGIARAAAESPRDAAAFTRFWEELDQWVWLDGRIHGEHRILERKEFLRRLHALAAETGVARTPRGPGRVRILSAPLARGVEVPYLFVMGLGERSFPRLAAPEPLFDEPERQSFKQAGLDFPCVGDMMPDEMLLFYQLVTRASQRLVLSYPAVDEKGQALLPSSFLTTVLECFTENAVPVERRGMLIERFAEDLPHSPAEYRVRVTSLTAPGQPLRGGLPPDLAANLSAAASMARLRLHAKDFSPYDGLFRNPAVIAEVGQLFRPEKVLSPTALELYIACPFQFFLRQVLRLEPLEEPREEIESTRRGQAFHRALSRLHLQLQEDEIHGPTAEVNAHLLEHLQKAIDEDVERAPSLASKQLWRLEGKRLMRVAARYTGHWNKYLEPWLPHEVRPRPSFFEVDFGSPNTDGGHGPLVLRMGEVEVRIGGRIDRVDVADLADGIGFWIIDYKTGRSAHYTGSDLREFRRLQLTLYALAVEKVLLAGQAARPLGLHYWMVTETGSKPAMPGPGKQLTVWLEQADQWPLVREELERWVVELIQNIRTGTFPLKPRSEQCTLTCDFSEVCRISQVRSAVEKKTWRLELPLDR